jgi:hypothetical protein
VNETTALVIKRFQPTDAVGMCALDEVDEDDATHRYLIAPCAGGRVLAGGVRVVTPARQSAARCWGSTWTTRSSYGWRGKLRMPVVVSVE